MRCVVIGDTLTGQSSAVLSPCVLLCGDRLDNLCSALCYMVCH